jgi:RimJ/RimL family protein N-acetyltransferase
VELGCCHPPRSAIGLRAGPGVGTITTVTDDPPADFSVKPTLTGEAVVLRPFVLDKDMPALREMLQDPEVLMLTGAAHGPAEIPVWDDEAEERIRAWYSSRNEQPDRIDLAVTERATGQCVGEVVLNDLDAGNVSCGFRVALGPKGRNRGLGTEAVRMIVGYGFEQLGMHRISLEVYSFNARARRVYEKVGFVVDGVLREALRWDGRWLDATVMSVLAPEWDRHHGRP